ncbi:MAG: ABC transporter ATP-binding protein [Atribacterota bacterium]|jgi:Fe-S cluster assembly ATP-binding protein|nr:ABC transporter ATP-binding protein [Atribacterota bacterium]MDD4896379.1 ABC transporter ATP-binding protein [Atribacterota bacterium]MDD5636522.1 ABC transporter ATP-binding protein [Atribacterota bacterium]
MKNILEVKDLSLSLNGRNILKNINMEVWEGYVHAIVGPNGAGKSTLASAIMGLEGYRHYSGSIRFKGKNISKLSIDERARMGITFGWQEPARYEGLLIRDFLKAAAGNKNNDFIHEQLERVGLDPDEYANRAVDKTLSGGERKKVELASILAMDPDLVLLDEPDSGIDVETLDKMFEVIKEQRKKKRTIILITHSLAVLKQADHAFIFCNGEILKKDVAKKVIPYFKNKCLPCKHKNIPEEEGVQLG